ncbi:phage tail tape measure protein [Paenibacillus macerans]|uniref:Phage tail tape measure protein n=1 Tax=Paenibacillus macerans TaxID=44252 RepID=A0A6N8F2R2_PAEMA|nr:phage tail tape measure protein [Paenibacillus macerans]MUG24772.1 phage tail tape measure protein [Paenibacillus macerans]
MGVIGNLMFAVGFKANTKPLQDAEKKIGSLKLGVIGLGAAIGGLAVASVAAASEFEKSMSQVQMATGQTAEQMEATKEVAKNLYSQNFGEDWADLGSSIAAVQQVTGQAGDALEDTTRSALLLRDSFGYEINESIKSVDTMMRQFGITSEQAYDLLAQGTQKGLNKSDELLDSANEYANQFAALGFSAEDMFDVFAAGSAEGVFQLDKVGDAVKEFNIRAKDGSKSSIEAFEMLGLNADTMMHTFAKGGPEAKAAFSQILQMISDIEDPVQKNQIGVALLGTQFEDLEASVVAGMGRATSQFKSTGEALAELNKVKFDKPGEAFAMFGRQLETGILIPIGQKILPYLTMLGQWFADHKPQIEAFGAMLADKIGGAIDGIVAAVQAALPTLQEIWNTISSVATSFTQWDGALPTVVGLTAAFVSYKAAILAVNTAQKLQSMWAARAAIKQAALNLVMSLNPIGLVVAAIAGLVAAFVVAYNKSETFRNIVNGVWESIKKAFSATMSFFTDTVPAVFGKIINFIKTWGPKFLIAITGPVGWAVALIVKHWDQIKAWTIAVFTAIKTWLVSTWESIRSAISNAVTGIWTWIVSTWSRISETQATIVNGIRDFLTNIWNNIVNNISNSVTSIKTKITNIWDQITGFLKGINLFEIGKNIIDGLINGISSMATAVVDKVKNIGSSIVDMAKGVLDIHSPSRVMFDVGFNTGEGLAQGIEGMQGRVAAASADMTEEIVPQASPTAAPARALAPARVPGAAGAGGRVEISVKIDLRADASDANVATNIGQEVDRRVQAAIEQAFRRLGLPMPEVSM